MQASSILVVEDEGIVAQDIRQTLVSLGYAVPATVASAEEALRAAEEKPPSLALLDIRIRGELDGIATAEVLRDRGIPVVFLTSYSDEVTLMRARAAQPFGYLLKPFNERELRAAIETALYKHEMEERLAARERWFSTTLMSIGDAVIAGDPEGRVSFMNPSAVALTGWPQQEAIGRRLGDVFRIVDRKTKRPHALPLDRAIRNREAVSLPNEVALLTKRGASIEIGDSCAPIVDDQGDVLGTVLVFRDIARERQAERALRESEAHFRALFDESPVPKWLYDRDSLRILVVNDQAVRHYGYSRDEFLGMTIRDLRSPEGSAPEAETPVGRQHGLERHRKKDGRPILVEVWSNDFSLEGRRVRLVEINDVTEHLRVEEQLRQAQKMEAIGKLAGGIAHDFNNLLSVILSYTSLLLEERDPTDPARDDIREIHAAGQRAAELTRQLLAFGRRQVLEPKVLDLNELVGSLERMVRRVVGEDIELRTLLSPAPTCVWGDQSHLEQVVVNLVVNARDAMEHGGTLSIETAKVVLDDQYVAEHLGATPGPHVMLTVTDTGVGMDEETVARIFEPFFTTKDFGKGTGLGLSTVFGIVKQSGGHITVTSALGQGTAFKVYLPRVEPSVDVGESPSGTSSGSKRGSETILVVEDDDQVRAVVRGVLRRAGYRILEAADAASAREIVARNRGQIQLLLADIIMPKVSGPELAASLLPLCPSMRVLFMSGYPGDSLPQGLSLADHPFVRKPLTPEVLTARVRDVLDQD